MIMFEGGLQEATRHELHDCWQCLEKLYMKDGKRRKRRNIGSERETQRSEKKRSEKEREREQYAIYSSHISGFEFFFPFFF